MKSIAIVISVAIGSALWGAAPVDAKPAGKSARAVKAAKGTKAAKGHRAVKGAKTISKPTGAMKPTLALKTKLLDGKVFIPDGLQRHAKLYAELMADGRRVLAEKSEDAVAAAKDDRVGFAHGPWTFTRAYALRVETGRFVSVSYVDDSYMGGAHPNYEIRTLIWDKDASRPATLGDILIDANDDGPTLRALAPQVRRALQSVKQARRIEVADDPQKDDWLKAVAPRADAIGAPSLAPATVAGKSSGLTFHFSPATVGPYAEGSYVAFVPAADLKPYLRPEVAGMFAGNRPKTDPDGD
jgi:hypothetical protein